MGDGGPEILKDYSPKDILNADETGLQCSIGDSFMMAHCRSKEQNQPGSIIVKDRLKVLLACDMNGREKLEALVICKCNVPRYFKNVKKLPVNYEVHKNAILDSTYELLSCAYIS